MTKNYATPPVAPIIPSVTSNPHEQLSDDYAWLQDSSSPATHDYLQAENAYTEANMSITQPLQQQLYEEIIQRIKLDDTTVPWRYGDYYYYSRHHSKDQYAIFCRTAGVDGAETILLDENELAKASDYLDVGCYQLSPNQRYFAYTVDTTGDECYELVIYDTISKQVVTKGITNICGNVAFGADNQTLFYIKLDEQQRPFAVYAHNFITRETDDVLVYQETDEHFYVEVALSKSQRFIFIQIDSKTSSEIRYLPANSPLAPLQILFKRRNNIEYHGEHHGDYFYVVTNDDAANFRLLRTPVAAPSMANSEQIIAHRENVIIDDIDVFKSYVVVLERELGLATFRVVQLDSLHQYAIDFAQQPYSIDFGDNYCIDTDEFRYEYESLTTPASTYDYSLATKSRNLLKQDEVKGQFCADDYDAKRLFAIASDGSKIPISLVYKKDLFKPGTNPLYLYGYGAYGISCEPSFSYSRLSLLDRGFVWAIAHVRGGGECGKSWYEGGKLEHKSNTFTDFICCAKYLLEHKYVALGQLVIAGGSAGGLLMGAVANMAPELFAIVVAQVPFVDTLNTMLDDKLPLTITEYEEWGNPLEKKYYELIKSYSPYDNIQNKHYPDILIICSFHDSRVSYWEAAKYTAKLRRYNSGDSMILLKTEMDCGHGGVSGRFDVIKETVFQYAFICQRLEISRQTLQK